MAQLRVRGVTCHMGSYSVTCYLTQVNTPRLNPIHAGRYSIYLPRGDGRLSWPQLYRIYKILQYKIQPPDINLAAVQLGYFYGWTVVRLIFRRIFSGRTFFVGGGRRPNWAAGESRLHRVVSGQCHWAMGNGHRSSMHTHFSSYFLLDVGFYQRPLNPMRKQSRMTMKLERISISGKNSLL